MSTRQFLAIPVSLIALIAIGCGSGSRSTPTTFSTGSNPQQSTVTVNVGDSPADSVLAFEVNITSITLTKSGGGTVSLLTTPVEVELRHLAGTLQPIALASIPTGSFTQASVTLSAAEITFLNPATGLPVHQNLPAPSGPVTVTFSPALTIAAGAQTMNFDFNLAGSITIDASGNVTFTPKFTTTTGTVMVGQEDEEEHGEIEDVHGTVTAVTSNSFTIAVKQSSQTLTFAVNSSTRFDGVSSLAALTKNMVVEVNAVTQQDGSLLATKVEAEVEDNEGLEAEGIVVSTTGVPVTQFSIVVQDEAGPGAAPTLGTTLVVNVNSNTQFRISSDGLDLSNLGFSPTFNASTLAKGQAVAADSASNTSTTAITAAQVRLKQQGLSGSISAFTQSGGNSSFTLNLPSDSALRILTGQTTVQVSVNSSTRVNNVTLANGANVMVRGLLFFSGSSYRMVAKHIMNP